MNSDAMPARYNSTADPKYLPGTSPNSDNINNIMINEGKTTGVVNVVIIIESCIPPGPFVSLKIKAKIDNIAINTENEYNSNANMFVIKENNNL